MQWQPITIRGQTYDLTHLHPFQYEFVIPAKGDKPQQTYQVRVTFSLHCFTRSVHEGEQPDPAETYSDSRENRVFDTDRHKLSFKLRDVMQALDSRKCFHTGHGNFFTVELVSDTGQTSSYEIFFKPSRGKHGVLLVFVQSAYVRGATQIPLSKPHPHKPIRFSVIAHNTMAGKAIKEPPK